MVHFASRNDFLEAKVVEGNEVNRLTKLQRSPRGGKFNERFLLRFNFCLLSRSTRASRMKERMWVVVGLVKRLDHDSFDPRFEKLCNKRDSKIKQTNVDFQFHRPLNRSNLHFSRHFFHYSHIYIFQIIPLNLYLYDTPTHYPCCFDKF